MTERSGTGGPGPSHTPNSETGEKEAAGLLLRVCMSGVYLRVWYRASCWVCTRASCWVCVPGHHAGCVYPGIAWWVYTSPTMVGIHLSLLYLLPTTLGIPTILPLTVLSVHHRPLITRCAVRGHQAQFGRNPWVGASQGG